MRIIAFSDYRIQDIDLLVQFVNDVSPRPDLLIYGGDDVTRFAPYSSAYLLALISANKKILTKPRHSTGRSPPIVVRSVTRDLWLFGGKGSANSVLDRAMKKIYTERSTLGYHDVIGDSNCLVQSIFDGVHATGAVQIANEKRNLFEKLASLSNYGLCAVIGNDDYPFSSECIWGDRVYNVQKNPLIIDDYAIVGIEGAIRDPKDPTIGIGYTLYTEASLQKRLERIKKIFQNKKLIIVSHCPPRNALDLALRFGMRNIGSRSLRSYLDNNSKRVPLVVCGHVHLHGGKNLKLGETMVVNAASHDNRGEPGRVATIDLDINHGVVDVKWEELYELDGIYRIGPATSAKFKAAGIDTIEKIVQAGPQGLMKHIGCSVNSANNYYIRAKATLEKSIVPISKMKPVDENAVFLDIETDLSQSLVWLIGMYFKKKNKFIQLLANTPKQEHLILKDFAARLAGYRGVFYTFSGTSFDERVLKSRMDACRIDYSKLPEFVDVYHEIQSSIAFPLKSYSLKSIANYFGYGYRHPELDGMSVALEYLSNYQKSKNKSLLKKLLEYNEDDVRSLPWLLEKMTSITGTLEVTTQVITSEIFFMCGGCGKEFSKEEYISTRFCSVCGTHRTGFHKKMTAAPIMDIRSSKSGS